MGGVEVLKKKKRGIHEKGEKLIKSRRGLREKKAEASGKSTGGVGEKGNV